MGEDDKELEEEVVDPDALEEVDAEGVEEEDDDEIPA